MIRRICNFLICLALLSALATGASAAGSSVTLKPSAEKVARGDTFTVVADLSNADKVGLGSVALDFDTTVFELTGGRCHVDDALFGDIITEERAGTFLLMLPKAVSGKIFTFELKVRSTAPLGEHTISGVASIGADNGSEIPVTGAQVTVALPTGNVPEATVPATTQPQATQPQQSEASGITATQPVASVEGTVPQTSQETTESTESSAPETTTPTQTEPPVRTDTPKASTGIWTGAAAAFILGVIGIGVKLFRKKRD